MQDQRGKAGIAERLIKEQSFREAARQAFQQADQTQTAEVQGSERLHQTGT